MTEIAVIDLSPFTHSKGSKMICSKDIGKACRENGFFYVSNHGVDLKLQNRLEKLSREFFELPMHEKMKIEMKLGKHYWRGYFPLKGELTSGLPDLKEGLYFGEELPLSHPAVVKNTPMHGPNLFPQISNFEKTVIDYMNAVSAVAQNIMRGVALSLNLEESYFYDLYTKEPLTLFRIFNYPFVPNTQREKSKWGVGEHTDYGLLTVLKQDDVGGLEVKTSKGWIDAPPIPNTFVCNIGDMLDKVTGGLYRSTPHRVKPAPQDRLSFPFFFDPNFFSKVEPIHSVLKDDSLERWDKSNIHEFQGTYGDYVLRKVGKVFPELQKQI